MKNEIKFILGTIIAIFAFIFLCNEFQIFGIKFWGVRTENAKREVFENSQSYVQGKRQELTKLHHEWIDADAESKRTIEATIRMSFADFDATKLDDLPELKLFLENIRNN